MNKFMNTLCGVLTASTLVACGDGTELKSTQEEINNSSIQQSGRLLSFTIAGLEHMEGQHYEGWVIYSDGPVSTGRFNIIDDATVAEVNRFGFITDILGQTGKYSTDLTRDEQPSAFVLTIEPDGDEDLGPSKVHYLGGDFLDDTTIATVDHTAAIDASFADVAGQYILATPTNNHQTDNQGIWYLDPATASPSLKLPELADGFAYEGWVVNTETDEVISTGIFRDPTGADSDGAGVTAGPLTFPLFPGQDFITRAHILNSGVYKAVISVEPYPDYDPAPFTLKVLATDIPQAAAVTTLHDLSNISNEADLYIKAAFE